MPGSVSTVKWQLDYSANSKTGSAAWDVPDDQAREWLGVIQLLVASTDEEDKRMASEELPHEHHPAALRAFGGRHALRVRAIDISGRPRCVKLAVAKSSRLIQWESPLTAMQRAIGYIGIHTCGVDDLIVYRLSPADVQHAIARGVRMAVEHGTASVPGRCLAPGNTATDVYVVAGRDINQYEPLAAALLAQRDRVAGGGDSWTIEEQLRKLASLQMLALSASHKAEHGGRLTDEEASIFTALAEGRRALEAEAERSRVGGQLLELASAPPQEVPAVGVQRSGHGSGGCCHDEHS